MRPRRRVLKAQAPTATGHYTVHVRRFFALLFLLLPSVVLAGPIHVVPELGIPLCGSCGLAAGAVNTSFPALRASLNGGSALSLSLAPSLVPAPVAAPQAALAAAAPSAVSAPSASDAPRILLPGQASGRPQKLIVAAGADVPAALAAALKADREQEAELPAATAAWLRALFDAAGPEAEPGPFIANPLAPGVLLSHPARLHALAAGGGRLRADVDALLPALRRSVALSGWNGPNTTLDGPCCGDAAPKLAALLRLRGYDARVVEAEFHVYVVVRHEDADIVVDPTFRQFFGREKAPEAVPQVFVGTWAQLGEAFSRHHRDKSTRYDVGRLYRSEARSRPDLARAALEALLGAGPEPLALRPALPRP
jgi:hypothetical protein